MTRVLVALSFVAIVLTLPKPYAEILAFAWGCVLLAAISYVLARARGVDPVPELRYLSMLPVTLLTAVTVSVLARLVSLVSAAGNPVVVTMTDKPARYVPEKITVKVGTTVEFRNTGQVVHDVTTDASVVQDKADVSLPPDAKPFDSGFIPPGQS